jgi:hypothetical protein
LALSNASVTSLNPEAPTEPLEDIAAWLSSDVASDPLLFVQQAFVWGQGELANGSGPEPWQAEILADIRDGLPLGRAIQIAVASGHGVGKTALIAWLVLWAIATFPDTRGIVISRYPRHRHRCHRTYVDHPRARRATQMASAVQSADVL